MNFFLDDHERRYRGKDQVTAQFIVAVAPHSFAWRGSGNTLRFALVGWVASLRNIDKRDNLDAIVASLDQPSVVFRNVYMNATRIGRKPGDDNLEGQLDISHRIQAGAKKRSSERNRFAVTPFAVTVGRSRKSGQRVQLGACVLHGCGASTFCG